MLDRVFDNHVMNRSRRSSSTGPPEGARDPSGVRLARELLDRAFRWLDERLAAREWAAAGTFSLADCAAAPALLYASWAHPFREHAALSAYLRRLPAGPRSAAA